MRHASEPVPFLRSILASTTSSLVELLLSGPRQVE